MARGRDLWLMVPRPIRSLPADLAAMVVLTVLTIAVATLPGVRETPLRIGFGLAFVLFLPGYALVAALFPEASHPADENEEMPTANEGIDGIERVALSFGLSIAVVPLVGLVLNFTPWGIRLGPILVSVGGLTIGLAAIAAARRWELPPEDRFSVPYHEWAAAARAELLKPETRTDAALNVVLVLALLLAMSSVAYAVAVPQQGESFSEFYLLTEDEDGELVADNYPTEFVRGEPQELIVGIGNQEHEANDYTVVVQLQRVDRADDEVTVRETEELDRFETGLEHDETWHHEHEVAPETTDEELRLMYLLYRGDVPATPTEDDAYRTVHLWISVSEPGSGSDSGPEGSDPNDVASDSDANESTVETDANETA